jgi:hypothetical protein
MAKAIMTMAEMTTEEQISKKEDDLDDARRDLQDTMTKVDEKLERTGFALLGYAMWRGLSEDGSREDGGETAASR